MKITMKPIAGRLPFIFFVISAVCLIFSWGAVVGMYRIFPYPVFAHAAEGFDELRKMLKPDPDGGYYKSRGRESLGNTIHSYKGLNLVTRVTSDRELVAEVMDMNGRKLHEWNIDWFRIWPDATHVPKRLIPKSKPGTQISGAVVMEENGDLVFGFHRLGLVRVDRSGKVLWRLPYLTHHSLHQHDDGNLWVCGQKDHTQPDPRFPNRLPPFEEYTILEVTPDGTIAEEWSVADLLRANKLHGLLHLGSISDRFTHVKGDSLHLNDVEPFSTERMEEDFFTQGDILVSLRNISTVFVFNRDTREIKFIATGWFVRQHDPDFIDGNTFSVFDNNEIAPVANGHQSRIVIVSARENTSEVFFEGNLKAPFYTDIMGRHQWLPNGNLLITESTAGRAFEINRQGEVVWEHIAYVGNKVVGLVDDVQRLPLEYGRLFGDSR